jgi:hypothetical protein
MIAACRRGVRTALFSLLRLEPPKPRPTDRRRAADWLRDLAQDAMHHPKKSEVPPGSKAGPYGGRDGSCQRPPRLTAEKYPGGQSLPAPAFPAHRRTPLSLREALGAERQDAARPTVHDLRPTTSQPQAYNIPSSTP